IQPLAKRLARLVVRAETKHVAVQIFDVQFARAPGIVRRWMAHACSLGEGANPNGWPLIVVGSPTHSEYKPDPRMASGDGRPPALASKAPQATSASISPVAWA